MSFLTSTSFHYFISFLIFALVAYKYIHKKTVAVLKERIQHIADVFTLAHSETETAQQSLVQLQEKVHTFKELLAAEEKEMEKHIKELQIEHRRALDHLLEERQKHYETLLKTEVTAAQKMLAKSLAAKTLDQVVTLMQADERFKTLFSEKSLELLKENKAGNPIEYKNDASISVHFGIEYYQHLWGTRPSMAKGIASVHNLPRIDDWLNILDKDWPIPDGYLTKEQKLRDQLFTTATPDFLLHGDLHHDNILQKDNDWVVAILAWVWALEDGCDTIYFEQLTKIFDRINMNS